jgi:HSP20 family protein
MTTFRRDPFAQLFTEFDRVQQDFNRLFAAPQAGFAANLWQDENAVYAELDLPAVDPSKLDVTVTEGTRLTVAGERPTAEPGGAVWVRQERPSGKFSREFTLPVLVDADKVEARYEHGVLKLTLPKSEAAKPRKISVQA